MARIDSCPDGHKLKLSIARAGLCDGCRRFVEDGERVQNCHTCNWYLCDDCRPASHSIGAPQDLWGAIANLFMGDVCSAPVVGQTASEELDYTRRRRSKKNKGVQKSQEQSSDIHSVTRASSVESDSAGSAVAATQDAPKEFARSADFNVKQKDLKPAVERVQPLDLLDDLDILSDAKHQDLASTPTTSTAAIIGGA